MATGKPATFRPPHTILVTSPTDCPVQLAPAGIFPEQKEVTFLISQKLYPITDSTHPRFTHYFYPFLSTSPFYPFSSPHIFTPFWIIPSCRCLYLFAKILLYSLPIRYDFYFLSPYPFLFYYIFSLITNRNASLLYSKFTYSIFTNHKDSSTCSVLRFSPERLKR